MTEGFSWLKPYFEYLDRIAPGYRETLEGEDDYRFRLDGFHTEFETPRYYQHFLKAMGTSTGPALFPELNFQAKDLYFWYATLQGAEWFVPDHFQMLAKPKEDAFYWYLAIDEETYPDDAVVFKAEATQNLEKARNENFRFNGLRDMLYLEAFTQLHMAHFDTPIHYMRAIQTPDETAALHDALHEVLAQAGLQPIEGPSSWLRLYERDDLRIAANRECADPDTLTLYMNGTTAASVRRIQSVLEDTFPFEIAEA